MSGRMSVACAPHVAGAASGFDVDAVLRDGRPVIILSGA
jgi:hypothetical protein